MGTSKGKILTRRSSYDTPLQIGVRLDGTSENMAIVGYYRMNILYIKGHPDALRKKREGGLKKETKLYEILGIYL